MGREPITLVRASRIANERLYKNPVKLEPPDQASEVPRESIRGYKTLTRSSIAVCEPALSAGIRVLWKAFKIEGVIISKAKLFHFAE